MRKKITPKQQVEKLCIEANETIKRWKSHKINGCSDPTYPDGVNMNLLRNHLFYYKRQIRDICFEHKMPLPPEAFLPDLPYTDSNYFADPTSDRAKRIMSNPYWKCANLEKVGGEYDEMQLSLI